MTFSFLISYLSYFITSVFNKNSNPNSFNSSNTGTYNSGNVGGIFRPVAFILPSTISLADIAVGSPTALYIAVSP